MWSSGSQSKTQIEEANRHLTALMDKINVLEEEINNKDIRLKQKEDDFTLVMQEIHVKRQEEIKELNDLIYKQNVKLQRLERDLVTKDSELNVLRKRCRMFDEVLRYKNTMAKLAITLEQAEQYASLAGYSYAKDSEALVHTDPAPPKTISTGMDVIDQVGQTFLKAQFKNGTLAELAENGHRG